MGEAVKKQIKELSRRLKGKLRKLGLKRKLHRERMENKADIRELIQQAKEKRRRIRLEREGLFCFKWKWKEYGETNKAISKKSQELKEIKKWIPKLIIKLNKAEG